MLTIAEALQIDAFAGARVVAGRGGLNRRIYWVHNVGVPNAAEWLNGGELMLTTALNIPVGEDAQKRYLLDIIDKGVVGLVITVGQVLERLPAYLCEIANDHDFPLIEISYKARFVDIARAANETIIQENIAMITRALNIHKTLTRIVLEGGGMTQLAQRLAKLINQSVSIENERFEALASVNINRVDEARRYTQQYGRTDPRLVRALESNVLPEIRRTLRPVFIPQMPHVGLQMERILAPIVVHGQIYGYVWIIADDRPVSELDHVAIESAATIAALILLHRESIQTAEASLKGNLLTRLIQGEMSGPDVLNDQALRYDVDLRRAFRVLLVECRTAEDLLDLYRRVNHMIVGRRAIAGQFSGQLIVLTSEDADALVEGIHSYDIPARIGVSGIHRGAESVRTAYSESREVLEITGRFQGGRTVYFEDLGYLHPLYHAGPEVLKGLPHVPALRTLRDEQQADLFRTLETYLDAGGNGVSTAEALHIHRSTLNYRLQRIAEICHADLSNPTTRTNLQVSLKLLRLFEE